MRTIESMFLTLFVLSQINVFCLDKPLLHVGLKRNRRNVGALTHLHLETSEDPVEYGEEKDSIETSNVVGCGWINDSGLSARITRSASALFAEFPWVVAVFKYNSSISNFDYHCVGSLIHPNVVLTVTHYFLDKIRYRIHAGDWDLLGDYEVRPHQISDVVSVKTHSKYNKRTHSNDVALLFLKTAIETAENVGFACLPPQASFTPPETRCLVTGWGYKTYENGSIQNILKKEEVPTVNRSSCRSSLRRALRRPFDLHQSMICAGGEPNRDACFKDGGAPLVCPYLDQEGRYYQAGIVSWGVKCGTPGVPGVYTKVSSLRSWIDDAVKSKGYTTSSYTV